LKEKDMIIQYVGMDSDELWDGGLRFEVGKREKR